MGATTIGTVADRINSVVALQGFTRAKDAFDFDRQPSQNLEKTYLVQLKRQAGETQMIGTGQEDYFALTILLAHKVRQDPHGAMRQLHVDMALLEDTLLGDDQVYAYYLDDDTTDGECRLPGPDSEYVIGQFTATVHFERTTD